MTPAECIGPGTRNDNLRLKVAVVDSWTCVRVNKVVLLALVALCVAHLLNAQSPAPPDKLEPIVPKLIIDPSSSSVSLGKAYLTVDPLVHKGKLYVGDYQLSVVPYFFMSEKGTLELDASDDVLRKFLGGAVAVFTGKASNNKQGKPKVITGKISPSTKTGGGVTFSVQTDNGPMVFNTSYHLGE